ncbi:MAG: hypothetical protein GTN86_03160, partial [Xanthomonadales bacterium]|nr:hypothetical protein [Xanthomonadales bacterium]
MASTDDDLYDITYDPHDPNYAYATTRLGGFWRSADGGATWSQANTGLPGGVAWRGLAADEMT